MAPIAIRIGGSAETLKLDGIKKRAFALFSFENSIAIVSILLVPSTVTELHEKVTMNRILECASVKRQFGWDIY